MKQRTSTVHSELHRTLRFIDTCDNSVVCVMLQPSFYCEQCTSATICLATNATICLIPVHRLRTGLASTGMLNSPIAYWLSSYSANITASPKTAILSLKTQSSRADALSHTQHTHAADQNAQSSGKTTYHCVECNVIATRLEIAQEHLTCLRPQPQNIKMEPMYIFVQSKPSRKSSGQVSAGVTAIWNVIHEQTQKFSDFSVVFAHHSHGQETSMHEHRPIGRAHWGYDRVKDTGGLATNVLNDGMRIQWKSGAVPPTKVGHLVLLEDFDCIPADLPCASAPTNTVNECESCHLYWDCIEPIAPRGTADRCQHHLDSFKTLLRQGWRPERHDFHRHARRDLLSRLYNSASVTTTNVLSRSFTKESVSRSRPWYPCLSISATSLSIDMLVTSMST